MTLKGLGVPLNRGAVGMVDWESIIDREGPMVWRVVYRLVGNRADAEDCYQETFAAALEVWRRQPVRHARAMLHRLATARAIDRLRARYRRGGRTPAINGSDSEPCSAGPGPAESAESAELSESLRTALASLPARQAEVFCLYNLDGWSYQEIADRLGATVDSVGVLLHRARARLRVKLAALAPPARSSAGQPASAPTLSLKPDGA